MNLINIPKNLFYSIFYIFLFFNINSLSLYALDKKDNQNNENKQSLYSISINKGVEEIHDQYILDSGDKLFIGFIGLDIFESEYLIDREGFLMLPEVGKYYARGKTISEILIDLKILYDQFIYNPDLEIRVASYRPVNVYISGEVANPGLYNISKKGIANTKIQSGVTTSFPKLFDVLRASGGITNYSDLSKIEVIRTNPKHKGGGKKKANINLLDLITKGEQDNNIYIYDEDIVYIPKSPKIIKDQIFKINLNPDNIKIFVSGDVSEIGEKLMKKGSSLNQAIALSGGKKILSGKVEFIRFNNQGKVERRIIRYNPDSSSNSYSNPILMDGDIINVKRTSIGIFAEALDQFVTPIGQAYSLINIFGGFK